MTPIESLTQSLSSIREGLNEKGANIPQGMPLADWRAEIDEMADGGGGQGLQEMDYSLEEQATGQKWIDGRTVYQKTVKLDPAAMAGVPAWDRWRFPHGISGLDILIAVTTVANQTSWQWDGTNNHLYWTAALEPANPNWPNQNFPLEIDETNIISSPMPSSWIGVSDILDPSGEWRAPEIYFTLRYTKRAEAASI